MTESNAQSGVPAVANQLGNEKQRRGAVARTLDGMVRILRDRGPMRAGDLGAEWTSRRGSSRRREGSSHDPVRQDGKQR